MAFFNKNRIPIAAAGEELQQLIQQIQQGQQDALGRLYDVMLSKVYGLVLRIVAIPSDAEEVTCDVFHQIWRNAKQFDSKRGNPSQWIMMMARSRALDRYRERRHLRHEVHLADDINSYSEEEALSYCPQLAEFESGSAVEVAIAALSPIQSELVKLAFFTGLTHQEIAEIKRLPLGTVKSHINRASATLRKTLSVADFK